MCLFGTTHSKMKLYHWQTKGQMKILNKTFVPRLRKHIEQLQYDRNIYVNPLLSLYNVLVHYSRTIRATSHVC